MSLRDEESGVQPTSIASTHDAVSTSARSSIQEAALTQEEIEKKPWKYIGYRGYSDFISSENDFYIIRRFGALNARVTLALQDQVSVMEEQLKNLDSEFSRRDAADVHNGSFRDDQAERKRLVEEIGDVLMKYSSFITSSDQATHLLTW